MSYQKASLIDLPSFGNETNGILTVFDSPKYPFTLQRAYWVYGVPSGVVRGFHAHKECTQVLICLQGKLTVKTEDPEGNSESFILTKPTQGLLLWPHLWHSLEYEENSIQLVLASMPYEESDYLRDKTSYLSHYGDK